jgi:adenylate cyclase class IV
MATTQFRIDDINISGLAIPFDTTKIELRNCSSFTWDGIPYEIDSVYVFNRKTYKGCDSIISVDFIKSEDDIGCFLPVELLSFFGYQENLKNKLEWNTASELNNEKFIIQRSEGEKFYDIGIVKGLNQPTQYEFIDDNFDPSYKIIYYRLKQVDFDKRFEYSDIISIENDIEVEITYFYNLLGQEITDIENFRGFYTKTIFYKNGQYQHKKLYKDY